MIERTLGPVFLDNLRMKIFSCLMQRVDAEFESIVGFKGSSFSLSYPFILDPPGGRN